MTLTAATVARHTTTAFEAGVDSDGNAFTAAHGWVFTYLERDVLGERIEGWPQCHVEPGECLLSEADMADVAAAQRALLDEVDPSGRNRRRGPAPSQAPLAATAQAPLDPQQVANLVKYLREPGRADLRDTLLAVGHGRVTVGAGGWCWLDGHDTPRPWCDDDREAVAALQGDGLLAAHPLAVTELGAAVVVWLGGES